MQQNETRWPQKLNSVKNKNIDSMLSKKPVLNDHPTEFLIREENRIKETEIAFLAKKIQALEHTLNKTEKDNQALTVIVQDKSKDLTETKDKLIDISTWA
jgi:hypothetical protein